MKVDLFDFELPDDRIALRPARPRDSARLMLVGAGGSRSHHQVRDLPDLLQSGDLLVMNDTRVIPAALVGRRQRDGQTVTVRANLAERDGENAWWAFLRPGKRVKPGDRLAFEEHGRVVEATATRKNAEGLVRLEFDRAGTELTEALAAVGHMPLPPYIGSQRADDDEDRIDYQTVFAKNDGAVAAPTAGLHFTPELLARLAERGIHSTIVTLHVGPGTFLPVKAEDTAGHVMHSEWGEITAEAAGEINRARREGGRAIAIGTTSLRLMESAAGDDGAIRPFRDATDIFITPGYRFRAVDGLMTNFHLPRSTLFMLVSAFSGRERMLAAYREAIEEGYRFYSYGDASLLFRADIAQ